MAKRKRPHGLSLMEDFKKLQFVPRIIFDVGANIGQSALWYARAWPDARIFSFEPVETTFSALQDQTRHLPNITCYPWALGDVEEQREIVIKKGSVNNSFVTTPKPGNETQNISLSTLDLFCSEQKIDYIDFLKIDTEGFDLKVLQGATGLLSNQRIKALLVEVGFNDLYKQHVRFEKIAHFLDTFGFQVSGFYSQINPPNTTHLRYANALFIHPEQFLNNDPMSVIDLSGLVEADSFDEAMEYARKAQKDKQWDEAIGYLIQALCMDPAKVKRVCYGLNKILLHQGFEKEAEYCRTHLNVPAHLIRKYKRSMPEWKVIDRTTACNGLEYKSIYPAGRYSLVKPETIDQQAAPPQFKRTGGSYDEAFVAIIPDGRIWTSKNTTAVMTANNELLDDLSTGASHAVAASNRLSSPLKMDETVACLLAKKNSRNYYHWMIETFPKLHLLCEAGILLDQIDKFLVYQPDTTFHRESMGRIGVPVEKIMDSEKTPYIQATRLMMPSMLHTVRSSDWTVSFLKACFLEQDKADSPIDAERIYLSREHEGRRTIVNEEEVVELLSSYGFQTVVMADFTIVQQAAIMAQARMVVGVHGAALTNIVFSSPGTKIIELFSSKYVSPYYWRLSSLNELDYYYLTCHESGKETGEVSVDRYKDLLVDLSHLSHLLNLAGL